MSVGRTGVGRAARVAVPLVPEKQVRGDLALGSGEKSRSRDVRRPVRPSSLSTPSDAARLPLSFPAGPKAKLRRVEEQWSRKQRSAEGPQKRRDASAAEWTAWWQTHQNEQRRVVGVLEALMGAAWRFTLGPASGSVKQAMAASACGTAVVQPRAGHERSGKMRGSRAHLTCSAHVSQCLRVNESILCSETSIFMRV